MMQARNDVSLVGLANEFPGGTSSGFSHSTGRHLRLPVQRLLFSSAAFFVFFSASARTGIIASHMLFYTDRGIFLLCRVF